KPQKGTEPKLFYIGIEGDLLMPTRLLQQPSHIWAEKQPGENGYDSAHRYNALASAGDVSKASQAREVYDVAHPAPWGWRIAAYLWTKSIAAGLLLVAAFLLGFGYDVKEPALSTIPSAAAIVFVALTTFLLVIDLKRPMRFYYLITKPNLRSWV